jgi:hypothetical protein
LLEDWETGLIKNNEQLAEANILKKYEGLQLQDPRHDVKYTVLSFNLDSIQDFKSRVWSILVSPPGYVADGEHDDDICGYVIDDETTGMISKTEQNPELNAQTIISAANDDSNDA